MSERIKGFTVILEQDWKDEDANELAKAISQLKGVLSVRNVVSTIADHIAVIRERTRILSEVTRIIFPD